MYFPQLCLTDAGRALIVKALNGATINFTKFALGDGNQPANPRALKELVQQVTTMPVNDIERSGDCVVLESTYANSGQKEAFQAREIGVFADDPDEGEILYAYANAGENAAHIPAYSTDSYMEQTFHVVIAVGDAEHVTATIGEYSGYASKVDLENHIDDYKNPHRVTAAQVGLGNVPNVTPANQQPIFDTSYYLKDDNSYDVQNIASGEKLAAILRKIRTAIAALVQHLSAENPHGITAESMGAAERSHTHNASDINSGVFPVARGGTNAATPAQACTNLGAMRTAGGTFTGRVNFADGSTYYVDADGTANFKKVYNAVFNDYAEFMPRGEATEPGDIVSLDTSSETERYVKATSKSVCIAGVHSGEFAFIIGGNRPKRQDRYMEENMESFIPVGLAGRVKTKVVGPVRAGDRIVPSDIPGVGRALQPGETSIGFVGCAVEGDTETEIRLLRVLLKG